MHSLTLYGRSMGSQIAASRETLLTRSMPACCLTWDHHARWALRRNAPLPQNHSRSKGKEDNPNDRKYCNPACSKQHTALSHSMPITDGSAQEVSCR